MKQEEFGNIMYDGKMINVDKEDIDNLKQISELLKERNRNLENKMESIFKQ